MSGDIKIFERPRHTVISMILIFGCFVIGWQYISVPESSGLGILAFVLGAVVLLATAFTIRKPKLILSDDYLMFKTGAWSDKKIFYTSITAWSLENDEKHFLIHLEDDAGAKKQFAEILINYKNLKKSDQDALVEAFNKKNIRKSNS